MGCRDHKDCKDHRDGKDHRGCSMVDRAGSMVGSNCRHSANKKGRQISRPITLIIFVSGGQQSIFGDLFHPLAFNRLKQATINIGSQSLCDFWCYLW